MCRQIDNGHVRLNINELLDFSSIAMDWFWCLLRAIQIHLSRKDFIQLIFPKLFEYVRDVQVSLLSGGPINLLPEMYEFHTGL